ncbi:heterokaryon incompatibility protein-domain-containing protein [Podospora conica]|nr:heterokaryon incompatibility protein-domain-containing protein [Schizothecium conicum]
MACNVCGDLARPGAGLQVQGQCPYSDIQSSSAGCSICRVLVLVTEDAIANLGPVSNVLMLLNDVGDHQLQVHCETKSARPLVLTLNLLPLEELDGTKLDDIQQKVTGHHIWPGDYSSPFTDSDDSFKWAIEKIDRCRKEHSSTCSPMEPTLLPDRVLGLGSRQEDVALRVSKGETGLYATLSHCWGGHLPIMLKRDTLQSFQDGIPWDSLPKTFQEATIFIRKLGYHSLWIDSLCIVQDDAEDWAQQSAKMAGIYENSAINLAASAAFDARDGLFTPHRRSLLGYITNGTEILDIKDVSMDTLPTPKPSYFVIKEWVSKPHAAFYLRAEPGLEATLFGRGWIYQERLLANRVLHFGNSELHWECNMDVSCQCGTWRHSLSRHAYAQFPKNSHQITLRGLAGDPSPARARYRWQRIVTEFSSMSITYESDRLPAIAGVAKQMQSLVPTAHYVLGMWKEVLFDHLLWQAMPMELRDNPSRWEGSSNLDSSGRRKPPTWTWASLGSAVKYPMEDPAADVSAFVIETPQDPQIVRVPWSDDVTSRLLGRVDGELVISGHLTETRLRKYTLSDEICYGVCRYDGSQFYPVHLDAKPSANDTWMPREPVWSQVDPNAERVEHGWWYKEPLSPEDAILVDNQISNLPSMREKFESCEEFAEPVYCLFVKCWKGTAGNSMFLVLRRASEEPEKFARIALLMYNPERLPVFETGNTSLREVVLV